MNKEYTYDIGKYTIGVDENGEDGIGLTVAKVENGEIYFLGNCYGENARCLDLLIKENQELKIQISAREEEYKKLEDNWNKLKELIDVKLYNTEYLQKLCGCRIDDVNHLILKIIKNEMQELERGVNK